MLSDKQIEQYSRQILLKEISVEGQQKLLSSKVLVIGIGGLGSPVVLYLAASGIGCLGLLDFDTVELSNLQRQVLHFQSDIGTLKVVSAKEKLKQLNPNIKINSHICKLTKDNIHSIISEYDFVIDGSDNFNTKYLINDVCFKQHTPCSLAGILKFQGQITTVIPNKTNPCFRCLFPTPPDTQNQPSCSSEGVLSPLAGLIGSLQATETLKFLTECSGLLIGQFLQVNLLTMQFNKLHYTKNNNCKGCINL